MAVTPSRIDTDHVDDLDSIGVIAALERTCELESKLRQAIQQTHPLTTTLDWDFDAADREREALLAISEQLEYLEDKLREYRFLDQTNVDQKAVLLGQLDSVRKELVEVLAINAPRVVFAKDIVREVLSFACAGDETPRGIMPSPSTTRGQPSSSKPSKLNRSSSHSGAAPLAESSLYSLITSPKPSLPSAQPSYASTTYENELWEGQRTARDKLAVPVPGATTSGYTSTTTTDTKDRPRRYGSSASHHHHSTITDEDIYGPPPPTSANGGAGAPSAVPAASPTGSANHGGMLRIHEMLSRAEEGLSAVAVAQEQRRAPPRILGDGAGSTRNGPAGTPYAGTEDWDGITPQAHGPGSVGTAGFVTPRDDLNDAGYGATSLWGGSNAVPPTTTTHTSRAPTPISNRSFSVRDWGGAASYSPDGAAEKSRKSNGGLGGVVGRVAGLMFVLGSVVAATVVASNITGNEKNNYTSNNKTKNGRNTTTNGASSRTKQKRSTSANGRTSKSSSSNKPSTARGPPADLPPWSDGSSSSSAPVRSTSTSNAPQQAPVMHVHLPPTSKSFPQNPPPDVTAAMG